MTPVLLIPTSFRQTSALDSPFFFSWLQTQVLQKSGNSMINRQLHRTRLATALFAASAFMSSGSAIANELNVQSEPDYQQGENWLEQRLALAEPGTRAKNLILFVGDGMSVTTLTAARILQGQQKGNAGEENALWFEHFPYSALVKTYNTNQQTPDSAGTMTALVTGVKTRAGMLSVGPEQDRQTCEGTENHSLKTLLEYASDQGFATGVVTTARITHATPAATYAHTSERDWEADSNLNKEAIANGCQDIATQLVEQGFDNGLDLILGGGKRNFVLESEGGKRKDEDLTQVFQDSFPQGQYLQSRNDLLLAGQKTPVLGLFSKSHMAYEKDRDSEQPSLSEMTYFALKTLSGTRESQNQGYVLVIEGARIDHAHHAGNAYRALTDAIEMSDAVKLADELTRDEETLIVVTADHSHTLSFAGYPDRGNPILGMVKHKGDLTLAKDDAPYTTLGYANGLGTIWTAHNCEDHSEATSTARQVGRTRWSKTFQPELDPNFNQAALVPRSSETHGSDDVALHAKGPGSQWFRGLLEQNSVFHLMKNALNLETTSPALSAASPKSNTQKILAPVIAENQQ